MTHWPRHGRIDGPIVMIGFGSIGKGTLPLIERHFESTRSVSSSSSRRFRPRLLDERGVASSISASPAKIIARSSSKYLTAG